MFSEYLKYSRNLSNNIFFLLIANLNCNSLKNSVVKDKSAICIAIPYNIMHRNQNCIVNILSFCYEF